MADTVLIGAGTTERLKVDATGLYVNGVAAGGGGKVLQVVSSSTKDFAQITSTTNWAPVSFLSLAITPLSATSNIYVSFSFLAGCDGTNNAGMIAKLTLFRDAYNLVLDHGLGTDGFWDALMILNPSKAGNLSVGFNEHVCFKYTDSTGSTAPVTYSIQAKTINNGWLQISDNKESVQMILTEVEQ